jgi:hypothetical protein
MLERIAQESSNKRHFLVLTFKFFQLTLVVADSSLVLSNGILALLDSLPPVHVLPG